MCLTVCYRFKAVIQDLTDLTFIILHVTEWDFKFIHVIKNVWIISNRFFDGAGIIPEGVHQVTHQSPSREERRSSSETNHQHHLSLSSLYDVINQYVWVKKCLTHQTMCLSGWASRSRCCLRGFLMVRWSASSWWWTGSQPHSEDRSHLNMYSSQNRIGPECHIYQFSAREGWRNSFLCELKLLWASSQY